MNCGCDARRDIMFNHGDVTTTEWVAYMALPAIAALVVAWRIIK